MRGMMEKHPEWAEDQLVGRSLMWDKKIDLAEQKKVRAAIEPSRAYPYDVNFK